MSSKQIQGSSLTGLTYQPLKRLGRGAFGEVVLARIVQNGQLVALKKIFVRDPEQGIPNNIVREYKTMQIVEHPNTVQLLDVCVVGQSIVLVQEYCCTNLTDLLQCQYRKVPKGIVKGILQQILLGVAACHDAGVLHRDLKPSNILLTQQGVAKIADFGLARLQAKGERPQYTHAVATRWYRAPELLYGAREYGPGVDMWAVGCIFAEILGLGPLFPGETDIDQLGRVIHTLGSIDLQDWPSAEQLPDWDKISFPPCDATPLHSLLPDASSSAILLLEKLLRYNPASRASASIALTDDYFFLQPLPACEEQIAVFVHDSLSGANRNSQGDVHSN